jgi:hypothetical protein
MKKNQKQTTPMSLVLLKKRILIKTSDFKQVIEITFGTRCYISLMTF